MAGLGTYLFVYNYAVDWCCCRFLSSFPHCHGFVRPELIFTRSSSKQRRRAAATAAAAAGKNSITIRGGARLLCQWIDPFLHIFPPKSKCAQLFLRKQFPALFPCSRRFVADVVVVVVRWGETRIGVGLVTGPRDEVQKTMAAWARCPGSSQWNR